MPNMIIGIVAPTKFHFCNRDDKPFLLMQQFIHYFSKVLEDGSSDIPTKSGPIFGDIVLSTAGSLSPTEIPQLFWNLSRMQENRVCNVVWARND
ncbi:hypothetical protein HF325_002125 [Metschnikowia pulcherrima]|uniref:Uncharacterized protein n=1 Tax=Metschnikowia pulcherrima TaxID=27326 RepID=A0A8H7LCT9_9ASCO|nr:hypothetical protein HF325_002125 [Metschnikowia pulcherrima]